MIMEKLLRVPNYGLGETQLNQNKLQGTHHRSNNRWTESGKVC